MYLTSAEYQTSTVALATNFSHTKSTKHSRVSNQTSEPKADSSPQQVVDMYHGQQLSYWRTALQINLKAFRTQTFAEPRQGRLCLEDLSSASLIFAIHCMWKRPSQSRMNCSLLGSFRIQLQIAFDSMRPKRTNCMFDRLHGLLRRATKPTRCLYKPDTLAKFQRYH